MIALLAASRIPSMSLNLNTNIQAVASMVKLMALAPQNKTQTQAVAIRIQMQSFVTVCSLYLPPSERISQTDLSNLIYQLPSPFIILGDLNGHSPFWCSTDSNSRGLQIEQLLADYNLCLLNSDEKTHFHLSTRTFHSDGLAISSPSLLPFLNLTVDNDLYNSDHFPLNFKDNKESNQFLPSTQICIKWRKLAKVLQSC
ncbi:hypothetical protein AVEN_152155-1 [Araneus ventricosus]|uniref:Endonuclease/exonuclease/phosphatase domain-containing protein n=1 Tax=Araneus ventricosus TaxID=182803 RepID=A0A4Y2HL28_ARAVE|nr:hypothetical protein AVEN_152155-1 [Araneus ventricosus]